MIVFISQFHIAVPKETGTNIRGAAMNRRANSVFWSLDAILLLSCFPAAAWGDRPFVCNWEAPWQNVFIDECIRKGISSAAPTECYNGFDF